MINQQTPDKDRIYSKLHAENKTLKEWAKENGFTYQTVVRVVNGTHKANRGDGLAVAIKLGIKTLTTP